MPLKSAEAQTEALVVCQSFKLDEPCIAQGELCRSERLDIKMELRAAWSYEPCLLLSSFMILSWMECGMEGTPLTSSTRC